MNKCSRFRGMWFNSWPNCFCPVWRFVAQGSHGWSLHGHGMQGFWDCWWHVSTSLSNWQFVTLNCTYIDFDGYIHMGLLVAQICRRIVVGIDGFCALLWNGQYWWPFPSGKQLLSIHFRAHLKLRNAASYLHVMSCLSINDSHQCLGNLEPLTFACSCYCSLRNGL